MIEIYKEDVLVAVHREKERRTTWFKPDAHLKSHFRRHHLLMTGGVTEEGACYTAPVKVKPGDDKYFLAAAEALRWPYWHRWGLPEEGEKE